MDHIEREFKEFCHNVYDLKITERKKKVDLMQERLSDEDVVQLLNKNSASKGNASVTWNSIFVASHRALKAEAERIAAELRKEKRPATVGRDKLTYMSLVNLVVQKANSGSYLTCCDAISCCLEIFERNVYKKVFGEGYVRVLLQILSVPLYWGEISPQQWNDLFEISINLYKNPPDDCPKVNLVDLLNYIIYYGCAHSDLALKAKKRFSFMLELVKSQQTQLHESELHLALTFCQLLKVESRKAVCAFAEESMQILLNTYENRYYDSSKKKNFLIDLLVILVQVHHPDGAVEGSENALACDWSIWKRQLLAIYCLVHKELIIYQNSRAGNYVFQENFLNLALSVMKQVYTTCSDVSSSLDVTIATMNDSMLLAGPSHKRRRVEANFQTLFDQLLELSSNKEPAVMWPWLEILSEFMSAYPEMINETYYVVILQFLSGQMISQKSPVVLNHCCRCSISLLNVDKCLKDKITSEENIATHWSKIGDVTLRLLELNQCDKNSFELAEKLLQRNPEFLSRLSQLFGSRLLHLNSYSLKTLLYLCQNSVIQDELGPEKCKFLLHWILPDKRDLMLKNWKAHMLPISDLAKTLIGLIMRSKFPENHESYVVKETHANIMSVQHVNSFENSVILISQTCNVPEIAENEVVVNWVDSACHEFWNLISRDTEILLEQNTDDIIEFCVVLVCQTTLLVEIGTLLELYQYPFQKRLHDLLTSLLNKLESVIDNITEQKKSSSSLKDIVARIILFGNSVKKSSRKVATIIFTHNIKQVILGFLWKIANPSNVSASGAYKSYSECRSLIERSPLNCKLLNEKSCLQIDSTKAICFFVCPPKVCVKQDFNNLLYLLKELPKKELKRPPVLQMYAILLKEVVQMMTMKTDVVQEILYVIRDVCIKWSKVSPVVQLLISILQKMVVHVWRSNNDGCLSDFLILFKGIYKRVNLKKFGANVTSDFVDLIGKFIEVDWTGEWAKLDVNSGIFDADTPVSHMLFNFIQNPFHQVRMTAGNLAGLLFSFTPKSEFQKKSFEKAFKLFVSSLDQYFIIEGELLEEESDDESVNRTFGALSALANVLVNSPRCHARVLAFLLQLSSEKNINTSLVSKVLVCVGNKLKLKDPYLLIENNISSLFLSWHEKHGHFKTFPWALTNCPSEQNFYDKYKAELLPVLIFKNDIQSFQEISSKLQISCSDLLKDCYPHVMTFLLPVLSEGKDTADSSHQSVCDMVLKNLGENMDKLLSSRIVEVIVNVLRTLYDPENLINLCSVESSSFLVLPDPEKNQNSYSAITKILQYLKVKLTEGLDIDLIVYLTLRRPDVIEKILLHLYSEIHSALSPEFQLLSYHRYITMCDLIGAHLNDKEMEELSTFIVYKIVHTLLHLTSKFYESSSLGLLTAALAYLERFILMTFPACAIIIDSLLHHIVTTIVPIAVSDCKKSTKDISKKANKILSLLIVDNNELLPGIVKLDPLPEDPQFEAILNVYKNIRYCDRVSSDTEICTNLSREIKHFIEAGEHQLNPHCRLEGLKYLKLQLSTRKDELQQLYSSLQNIRSSGSSESVLHQLICMLVGLTSSSDSSVAVEAARCLGELGPADLTTLVLEAECTRFAENFEKLHNGMATLLSNFLLDSHIQVCQATSHALYAFVKTFTGFNAIRSLDVSKQKLLYPFTKTVHQLSNDITINSSSIQVSAEEFSAVFKNMCPDEQISHKQWITNLAENLLKQFRRESYLYQLIPICSIKTSFSEEIVLFIIQLIFLSSKKPNLYISSIVENVSVFLKLHFELKANESHSETDEISNIYSNRASVKCILNIAFAIHHYSHNGSNSDLENEYQLNYLHVAKAAQTCSAYFTSVFYGELWFYSNFSDDEHLSDLESGGQYVIEYVMEKKPDDGLILQNLLYEAYTKIGDPDAVYGYTSSQLFNATTRIQHYQLEGKWSRIIETYDFEISKDSNSDRLGMISAIKSAGFDHLAGIYATASNVNDDTVLSEIQHECAWRLNQWTLPDNKTSFQKSVYSALKAISYSDSFGVVSAISEARNSIISSLAHTSLESTLSVYKYLSQLQTLQEIEDFELMDLKNVLEKWQSQDDIGWVNFEFVEPIIIQRIVLMGMRSEEDKVEICLRGTQSALSESHYSTAARCLHYTTDMPHLTIITQLRIKLEQAKVFWARGDTHIGRCMLRSLLSELKGVEHNNLKSIHSSALRLYGSWMAEKKSENADQIVKNYLIPAFNVASASSDLKRKMEATSALARYTDQQYQALSQYIKSSDFQSKVDKALHAEENVEKLRTIKTLTIDQRRATKIFFNQSVIDVAEISVTKKAVENYLCLAMEYYLKYLIDSDSDVDIHIFRLAALWLGNKTHEKICDLLFENIDNIPSYKFLVVLPQLAAHITNSKDRFSTMLLCVFERCALDHPHHTLPLILALANSYKDSVNGQANQTKKQREEGRVLGSKALLKKLLVNSKISQVVKGMSKLAEAYINLANTPVDKKERGIAKKLSKNDPLLKLGPLPQVLVTTVTVPFSKTADYRNIVGIQGFENYFELVGGVNQPKKIICIGTDGIKRLQLVKGNDDLRQDAVMMQVFTILNSLLQKNKRTKQRKLGVRTYKVVPMSQRSGVLEWCSNSRELGEYLTGRNGKGGAHHKYRPNDELAIRCREKMASVAESPKDVKLKKFNEVCQMIHPVMHHYFIESYSTPGLWFEKRLAYTHSVACTSMIGYILGLGDRHVTNILIDNITAELIHIDFGIAFEMGKCLPHSETVPFRLTRDIVDGMGISGIEGVFRRCCEETMIVLRNSQDTLMTILEVLLYDPLYSWTVLPQKTVDQQMKSSTSSSSADSSSNSDVSSSEVNEWAERALLRLKHKLQGTEDGSTGPKSVEGQVEWLIQEARDPINLCGLFNGWQAYL